VCSLFGRTLCSGSAAAAPNNSPFPHAAAVLAPLLLLLTLLRRQNANYDDDDVACCRRHHLSNIRFPPFCNAQPSDRTRTTQDLKHRTRQYEQSRLSPFFLRRCVNHWFCHEHRCV
jgi:hypothetical protein